MQTRWLFKDENKALSKRLSQELMIHPITARILASRGIKNSDEGKIFLNPKLTYLPDPFIIPDMEKAVDRIFQAVKNGEKIAVFGDYDTDGITSTALLVRFFREFGVTIEHYIPNRISEGYGLNKAGIDYLKKRGASLIVTADNGSNAHTIIDYSNSLGIDVVVTDHHEISSTLPNAVAIANPKRLDEGSEFRNLAGVGVAFYLICGIRAKLRGEKYFKSKEPDLKSYLDLVAIGTIADVVPLTEINRILTKQGIEVLKTSGNPGLRALANVASTELSDINTRSIAFRLSPRINAAGRMGNHSHALDLLITDDESEAEKIASKLNKMNSERQAVEKKIIDQLNKKLEKVDDTKSSVVLWSKDWHPGIIGIAASRITESHRKPCALISVDGKSGRGSVRSVGNFNVMNTLISCASVLNNYGGHAAAGGFDISVENLDKFAELFESHTSKHLTDEDKMPTIYLDAEISLSDITPKLIEELESLEPFGEGNPKPLLGINDCLVKQAKTVGTNHLKMKVTDNLISLDTIGFGLADYEVKSGKKYRLAGTPEFNVWNGSTNIQLHIKDIKPTEE